MTPTTMTSAELGSMPTVSFAAICPSCVRNLNHCHGTLIVHPDGGTECTEPACVEAHASTHYLVLECAELGDCACLTS